MVDHTDVITSLRPTLTQEQIDLAPIVTPAPITILKHSLGTYGYLMRELMHNRSITPDELVDLKNAVDYINNAYNVYTADT